MGDESTLGVVVEALAAVVVVVVEVMAGGSRLAGIAKFQF
jgi:hypothetical protein